MVNKIIAWVVVGLTYVIWVYGFGYIDSFGPESGMMPALIIMALVVYMMGRSPVPEGNMVTTIIESMKGFLMNIVWLTVAGLIYNVVMMAIGGGFDPMRLVYVAIFTIISAATSALTISAIGAAMKD